MTQQQSRNILLVEDDAVIALMEKQVLTKHGYSVSVVNNGEKAVHLTQDQEDIDLILMDIDLGRGIDGTEAASQILKFRDLPVVFLSSHIEPEVVEKTEGITSYGYIVKNSGETVLLASIKMAFRLFEARLQQKAHHEALMASEERFAQLFERAPLGYQSLDENGCFIEVNQAWLDTLGYERSDVLGRSFREFLPGEMKQKFAKNFEVFKTKGIIQIEFELLHKDGSHRYISFDGRVGRKTDGSFDKTHCILKDITEFKAQEERLRTSQLVFEHSIDMLCVAGYDGYFKVLNPAWERILGWSNEELLSRPWLEFVHPEDRGKTDEIRLTLVDGQEIYQFRNRYLCKDGSVKTLSWNSYPYPEDKIMIGVARNISDGE